MEKIVQTETYKILKIKTGPLATNCYLVSDNNKNSAIIDFAFCDEEIVQIFQNQNLKLKFVLLTHGHFDHIMGLENGLNILKQSCPVFINEFDSEMLNDKYKNASELMNFNVELNLNNVQFFKENATFELNNNLKFKAVTTPGHTKGSCSFILNDEILFSGDALFKNSVGRCDLFSGSSETTLKTIEKFKTLNPNLTILPGHGHSSTLKQELLNNPHFN